MNGRIRCRASGRFVTAPGLGIFLAPVWHVSATGSGELGGGAIAEYGRGTADWRADVLGALQAPPMIIGCWNVRLGCERNRPKP